MFFADRPSMFALMATDHGPMIIHWRDWEGYTSYMVANSHYDAVDIQFECQMLDMRRNHAGSGMVVIDGGANLGAHAITLAKHMHGWGKVLAFEPQERFFYALAGNVALNNTFNVKCFNAALGNKHLGNAISVPDIDYLGNRNYGGVTLIGEKKTIAENGQSYRVPLVAIDSLELPRLDLLKLDIEGMEPHALIGARETIDRCRPLIWVEHLVCGSDELCNVLKPHGYGIHSIHENQNSFAIHQDDPLAKQVTFKEAA